MRKGILSFSAIVFTLLLSACLKDVTLEKYSFYRPVYGSKVQVRANIKSTDPRSIEHPGKLFVKGNYVFLTDVNKGIHIIDYTNPSSPKNIAFIAIPGNVDLAVNGNYLYADQYTDLVTLDISNPLNVVPTKFVDKVFAQKYAVPDSGLVIVDWIKVDTTIRHDEYENFLKSNPGIAFVNSGSPLASGGSSSAGTGKAGSMSRFALLNNRLYTVDLLVLNVNNPANPSITRNPTGSSRNETIYPFGDKLFIGSSNGMWIYSVVNPDNPTMTGAFAHATACDPVITDGTYAYVTLRSGTICNTFSNQMDIVDVTNVMRPSLVKTYLFTNPFGLDKDGDKIFLCDGTGGLKILNAHNVNDVKIEKTFSNITAYDVVTMNNLAITVANDGLYFISYSDPADIKIISKLSIAQ